MPTQKRKRTKDTVDGQQNLLEQDGEGASDPSNKRKSKGTLEWFFQERPELPREASREVEVLDLPEEAPDISPFELRIIAEAAAPPYVRARKMKCLSKNFNKVMVRMFNKYEIFGRDFCDMVQGRRLRKHVMDGYLYLLCRHETTAIRLLDSDIVQRAGDGLDLDGAWGDISNECYLVNYRSWSGRHCVLYHNPHQRVL